MPPNRNSRTCRKEDIPGSFILNWQLSGTRRAKSSNLLVRRPMTACEACRAAKVKCNGQQECDQCVTRGLICKYTTPTKLQKSNPFEQNTRGEQPPVQSTPENIPVDFNLNAAHQSHPDHNTYELGIGFETEASADWADATANPRTNHLDWDSIDPISNEQAFESLAPSDPCDLNLFESLGNLAPQSLAQENYNPLFHDENYDTGPASTSPSSNLSLQTQHVLPVNCQCRATLMLLLPKVTRTMRESRLDEIFKVTGEVIQGCQDVVDCTTCQVSCTDLLVMMTVLQETHSCFDHIAKSDLDGAVKVPFGDYQVSSNNTKLRTMLVMDLVQRASAVLTSISSRSQGMVEKLGKLCDLAKANIAYLEATISHFRTILRCVTNFVEGSSYAPEGLIVTPQA